MLQSSYTSLETTSCCDIRICVLNVLAEDPSHRNQDCVASIWLLQQLAHAHGFAFSTAERTLSSRPAVAVQSTTTNNQIPFKMEISCKQLLQAKFLSALPDLGIKSRQLFRAPNTRDRFTNCLPDFRFGSLSLLQIHLAMACKSDLRLVMERIVRTANL